MGTPDRRPGRLEEEAILFEDQAVNPTEIGVLQRNGSSLLYKRDAGAPIDIANPGGVNVGADTDFLLVSDPPEPGTDYAITRSGGLVTKEEWTRTGGNLLKSIDYTRSGGVVTQEDRKVFDTDGTTLLGHLRIVYTRSGGVVTTATYTRVV